MSWNPLASIAVEVLQPSVQVAPNRRDLVGPDAIDSWRKLVICMGGNGIHCIVEHAPSPVHQCRRDGQHALLPKGAEHARLNVVEEAAAGKWIHPLQRLRLLERL